MIDNYQKQVNTKFISSHRKGVPELKNEYGSLNNLLKTILTGGYNKQSSVSASFDAITNTTKIILNLNHGFYKDQVVTVTDTETFSEDYRILSASLDTIDIYTGRDITNNIKFIEGAGLGFKLSYENTDEGILCVESGNSIRRCILKSIDKLPPNGYLETWSKYARVVIGVEIDSQGEFVDNIKSPYDPLYPNAEKTGDGVSGPTGIHGFAKWEYAIGLGSASNETLTTKGVYPTEWHIVGDSKTFYLMIRSQGTVAYSFNVLSFGEYVSYNPLEFTNYCLVAKDGFVPANQNINPNYTRSRQSFGALNYDYTGFILSDIYGNITKTVDNNRFRNAGAYLSADDPQKPWKTSQVTSLHPYSDHVISEDFYIVDRDNQLRGHHRGMNIYYGRDRYYSETPNNQGVFSLNVHEPNISVINSEMPLIFTLEDW